MRLRSLRPSPSFPFGFWGTFMQLDEFGAAFNLHNDVVELLRKFGADSASEVAEMEPSDFSEAGINFSQRLKIKTALKFPGAHKDSGPSAPQS
ncbi:unnamed protein product [Tilletia controversa]|nr:unnamed protein product [Tilletia controversa]